MKVLELVLKAPYNEIIKLRTLKERGQVDIYFVEPIYALSLPLQTLNEVLMHVVRFLNHGIQTIFSHPIIDLLLGIINF